VIEMDRLAECFDRRRRLFELDQTAPALLVQTAELRVMTLELGEGREGVGNAAEEALRRGDVQQAVAVIRVLRQQRPSCRERFGELVFSQQRA
jgi:hypothetical protein